MVSTGQTINYKKYSEQLKTMSAPVLPSQLPGVKVDLKRLIAYARDKGVRTDELTEQETNQFIMGSTAESLQIRMKESIRYETLEEWNEAHGS